MLIDVKLYLLSINQVLPSLREKHGEFMLRELVNRWMNHKVMVKWLYKFFQYLERYFISRRDLPSLDEVALTCFRDMVCDVKYFATLSILIALVFFIYIWGCLCLNVGL